MIESAASDVLTFLWGYYCHFCRIQEFVSNFDDVHLQESLRGGAVCELQTRRCIDYKIRKL